MEKLIQMSFDQAIEMQKTHASLSAEVEQLFAQWPQPDYPRICAIAAHTLRHRGLAADAWQPWLALAAWGNMLQENSMLARSLAIVARVYPDIARQLPASMPTPRRADYHALAFALGLVPPSARPVRPSSERMALIDEGFDSLGQDDCYGLLADAILRRDWELFLTAFEQLAEFILEGQRAGTWDAETNPGYEPIPAALAALARDAGLPVERLSDQTQAWIWPVIEAEPGVMPAFWPFDAV